MVKDKAIEANAALGNYNRQYVGARYVPKFFENPNGTAEWLGNVPYEAMTIVTYLGNSYTSKIPVPPEIGNPSLNAEYWALTGNYNEQVERYREEVTRIKTYLDKSKAHVTPQMFGAEGDGVSDDTAPFLNALNAGSSRGLEVKCSAPIYSLTADISLDGVALNLCGNTLNMNGHTITVNNNSYLINGCILNGGVAVDGNLNRVVENLCITDYPEVALDLIGNGNASNVGNIFLNVTKNQTSPQTKIGVRFTGGDWNVRRVTGIAPRNAIVFNSSNNTISDAHLWLNNYVGYDGAVFLTNNATFNSCVDCCSDTYPTIIKNGNFLELNLDNLSIINNNVLYKGDVTFLTGMSRGVELVHGNVRANLLGFKSNEMSFNLGIRCNCSFDIINGYPTETLYADYQALQALTSNPAVHIYPGSHVGWNGERLEVNINFYTDDGGVEPFTIDLSSFFGTVTLVGSYIYLAHVIYNDTATTTAALTTFNNGNKLLMIGIYPSQTNLKIDRGSLVIN